MGKKVTSYEILFNRINFYLFNVFVFCFYITGTIHVKIAAFKQNATNAMYIRLSATANLQTLSLVTLFSSDS